MRRRNGGGLFLCPFLGYPVLFLPLCRLKLAYPAFFLVILTFVLVDLGQGVGNVRILQPLVGCLYLVVVTACVFQVRRRRLELAFLRRRRKGDVRPGRRFAIGLQFLAQQVQEELLKGLRP